MAADGSITHKRHRDSDPDDLAAHYRPWAELLDTGTQAGWKRSEDTRWSCPPCSQK